MKLTKILTAATLFVILMPIATVYGQGLVPQCNGLDCDLCVFLKLVENVINFMLFIIFPLAVLFILYGGFTVMTAAGSADRLKSGREIITTSVVGIAIALVAWLAISSIIQVISGNSWRPWHSIQCIPRPPVVTRPPAPTTPTPAPIPSGTLSNAEALQRLARSGINVYSSGNCSDRTRSNCTSLEGIRPATIDAVIAVKNQCKCFVAVTGGTETGHASGAKSHSTGYKIDIRLNPQLNNYFQTQYTFSGMRSDGAALYTSRDRRVVAALEDTHWDILVK